MKRFAFIIVMAGLGIGTALFTKCGKDNVTNVYGGHDTLSIFTHDTLRIYSRDTILTSSYDTVLIITQDSITTHDTVTIYTYDTVRIYYGDTSGVDTMMLVRDTAWNIRNDTMTSEIGNSNIHYIDSIHYIHYPYISVEDTLIRYLFNRSFGFYISNGHIAYDDTLFMKGIFLPNSLNGSSLVFTHRITSGWDSLGAIIYTTDTSYTEYNRSWPY